MKKLSRGERLLKFSREEGRRSHENAIAICSGKEPIYHDTGLTYHLMMLSHMGKLIKFSKGVL